MSSVPAARSKPGSADVFTFQSYEIPEHWFWVERFLRRIKNPDWTLAQVKRDLLDAKAQLWVLGDGRSAPVGLVITRVENFHETRWGLVWIAAGDGIEHVRLMLDPIESWFRSLGCKRVEVAGRKGWERVLKGYGFKAVVLSKELA